MTLIQQKYTLYHFQHEMLTLKNFTNYNSIKVIASLEWFQRVMEIHNNAKVFYVWF